MWETLGKRRADAMPRGLGRVARILSKAAGARPFVTGNLLIH